MKTITIKYTQSLFHSQKLRTSLSYIIVFLFSIMLTSAPLYALPQGGQVAAGSARISMPSKNTMQINQGSNKAVIDWRSYNIGKHETVNYRQPNAHSISLNRVNPNQGISKIFGSINANGQVWLINSAGIWFSPTSHVNVGSLLATTASINNKDFMSGNYHFQQSPNWNGAVENDGIITVRDHGLAALVSPGVVNRGRIVANMGTVILGASKKFTVDFTGDQLINFQVGGAVSKYATNHNGKVLSDAVTNEGVIIANGGKIMMTAQAAGSVLDHSINMRGYAQANSVGKVNGQIILGAGAGTIRVSGKVIASGRHGGSVKVLANKINVHKNAVISTNGDLGGGSIYLGDASDIYVDPDAALTANALSSGDGGQILLNATNSITANGKLFAQGGSLSGNGGTVELAGDANTATTELYGAIDVSAAQGLGGEAVLLGKNVGLFANSSINANGNVGGGHVFVGGNYHGEGPLPNATVVYFDPNAVINANALSMGNGGQVILWANNTTRAYGIINAEGGALGGNGGFIETSGHYYLDANGVRVNTLAANGQAGTWLLDPTNIYIATNIDEAHAAGMQGSDTSAGTEVGGVFAATGTSTQDSFISIDQIQTALLSGNVTITTDNNNPTPGGGTGDGNVIFTGTSALSWLGSDANTSLTVNAANDITANLPSIGSSTNQTLTFTAGRDINIDTQINVSQEANVGTGNIVMTAGRNITFGPTSSILSYGPVTLTAGTGGSGNISIGGSVNTDIGNVSAQAPGSIGVTGIITAGSMTPADVSLQAGTNITQTAGSTIQSVHLSGNATTGINLAGANQVQVFTATNTTSGDIIFNDAFDDVNSILPVLNGNPFTGVLIDAVNNTGSGGNISLTNNGMLLVNAGNAVTTSGAGNITITTTGGNPNDLVTEGDVTTTTGNITLTAANQLLINSTISSSLANSTTTITGSAVGNTSLSTSGQVTGHNVKLNSTIGAVSELAPTASLNATNLTTTSLTGTTLTNNITTNSFAATNSGTGVISLATSVANLTINNIAQTTGAGTVSVVNNGGNETLSGQVSASGTVDLTAAGTISGAGSVINSSNLSTSSIGGVTLNGANAVTGFTANNTTSGNISFTNAANLTLGALAFTTDPNGNISVNNTGTLTVANSLSTGGTINLISTGNMNVQQSITSPTGSITLNATGGNGTTIGAGTGNVNISGASTVIGGASSSGVINVTGVGVTLTSPTSIVTTNNVNLGATSSGISENAGSTISANVLTANSTGGITLTGSNNAISTFNATNTTTGNIALTAGSANLAISGIAETGGFVNISNTGNLSTTGSITDNSSGQSIALTSTGGSIGIGSSVTASGTSTISLSAVNSSIFETAGGLLTGAGLTAHAASGINLGNANGVAQFTATNTASGNINLVNTAALLTVAGASLAGTGNIAINNTGALTTTGAIATTGAGTINLISTGNMNVQQSIASTTGSITLNSTGGSGTTIGAGTGTVTVSGSGTVGGAGTSGVVNVTGIGITLSSPNSIVTTNNVNLGATSGGISENAGSTISANVLTANSTGGITLTGSNNAISTFNATNTTTGNIALTAGSANLAISGIAETGGLVNISNTGNISTTGSITDNSSGQSIALTSTGGSIGIGSSVTASGTSTISLSAVNSSISETAGGLLTGAGLTAHAASGINLGNANGVAQFTATNTASGNINLVNTAALLTVAGASLAGTGNIAINNTGALTATGAIATTGAGTINLISTGNMNVQQSIASTTGSITLNSTGGSGTTIGAGTGTVTVSAAGTVGGAGTSGVVNVTGIGITLSSPNSIVTTNNVNLGATSGGILENAGSTISANVLTANSAGGITLTGSNNAISTFNATNTTTGNIALTAGAANLAISGISETGGLVNISNTGNISTTGSITDNSSGQSIALTSTGGSIGIGSSVTASGTSTLSLSAVSSSISETAGGLLTGAALTANAANGINLANASNVINTFNATNTATGNIALTAGVANLAISGIAETGGLVNISNTGNIATTGSITDNSSGQSIALTSTGGSIGIGSSVTASGTSTISLSAVNSSISETAGGLLTGAGLTAHAASGINLGNANGVAQFTATNTTSGNINLVNIAPLLTVTGASLAGAGDITINNTGALTTTGAIATTGAGNIGLTGTNGVVTIGANVTATSGNIGITSTGAANDVLFNSTIIDTTGAITINSGRDISLTTASGEIGTSHTNSVTLNAGRDVLTAAGTNVSAVNNVIFNAGRNINSAGSIDPADVTLTAVGTISQTGIVTANLLTATSGTGSGGGDMLINNINNNFVTVAAANQGATGNINIIDNVNSLSIDSLLQSNASDAAGTITLQNVGGSLVLNGNVRSQGGLITLANRQAVGDTFTNMAGVNAISGGTYHIWSYSPAGDQVGNLTNAPAFVQYNSTYPTTAVIGSGNGLLYKIAPTISVVATANRTYNATTVINLTPANYSVTSGGINNDNITVGNLNLTTSTNTSSPNVGTYSINPTVTYDNGSPGVTGVNASGIPVGIPVYDYSVTSSGTATITAAPLTASGVQANNKVYDGTTGVSFNLSQTQLSGLFDGDSVNLDLSGINGQFATKNVGHGIAVNYAGLTISGADVNNYFLTNPSGTTFASITPKPLTVQNVSANNKVYNGSNRATLTFNCAGNGCLVGVISGDNVALNQANYSAMFVSANPGNDIPVRVNLSIFGTDSRNYTITFPAFSADITMPSTPPSVNIAGILQGAYLNEIGTPPAASNAADLIVNNLNSCKAYYKRDLKDAAFKIDFDCPIYKKLRNE